MNPDPAMLDEWLTWPAVLLFLAIVLVVEGVVTVRRWRRESRRLTRDIAAMNQQVDDQRRERLES